MSVFEGKRNQRIVGLFTALAIGLVGVLVMRFSKAASPATAIEIEGTTLSGVQVVDVNGASGGKAIQFGAATATHYVDPAGNDTGSGLANEPWKTLQKAADSAPAGSVVTVRSGTYTPFKVARPGLTFVAAAGSTPTIQGQANLRGDIDITASDTVVSGLTITGCVPSTDAHNWDGFPAKGNAGIWVANADNVVISSMNIHDSHGTNTQGKPIGCAAIVVVDSVNTKVQNSEMYHNAYGVYYKGTRTAGSQTLNNKIHDNDVIMRNTTDNNNDDFGGIAIGYDTVNASAGQLAQGNIMYGNSGPSNDYGTDGGAFEIWKASYLNMTGNTISNNENILETGTDGTADCANNKFTGNTASGLSAGSSLPHSIGMILRCNKNMLIDGNTITNVNWWTFDVESGGSFAGSIANLTITNNTVSQAGQEPIYSVGVNPAGNSFNFGHNSFHSDSGKVGTDWNHVTYTSLSSWQTGTGLDTTSTWH